MLFVQCFCVFRVLGAHAMSKYIVLFFTTILFIAGVAFIAGATWHMTAFADLTAIAGFMLAILIFGVYLLLTTTIGFCGSCRESPCLLNVYVGSMSLLTLALIAVAVVLQLYTDQVASLVAAQWAGIQQSTAGLAMSKAEAITLL